MQQKPAATRTTGSEYEASAQPSELYHVPILTILKSKYINLLHFERKFMRLDSQ